MGQNLTGQTIASTYEDLVQISGSSRNFLTDGTGSDITSLAVTASNAVSSSYAVTASFALNAGVTVDTGSLMVTGSVLSNILTFTKGDGSTFNLTVDTGSAVTVNTGSLLVTASISNATTTFTKGDGSTFSITANNVVNANSASVATSASYAQNASTADNATTANSAITANTASYVANAVLTGSVSSNTLTFTKFDGSTFNLIVNTGSAVPVDTGSFYVSSSVSNATITFNQGDGTTEAVTVNNVQNATSASFATTASFAATASFVNLGTSATAGFTGSTWTFNHNLNSSFVIIDCYDSNNEEIIPQTIDLTSANQAVISFPVSVQGTAVASLGNGVVQTSITNNTYVGSSPVNTVSTLQSTYSTAYTQKLTITATGTYNLHVSQSGPHWVDFTGLASGTTANLNIYMWVDSFAALPANSGSVVVFTAGAGTGNYVNFRTLATGSGAWLSTGTSIGGSSQTVARNATLTRKDLTNTATNPTTIYKNADGDVVLSNPASSIWATLYSFTGSQGTPI